jgi:hypothetical protein
VGIAILVLSGCSAESGTTSADGSPSGSAQPSPSPPAGTDPENPRDLAGASVTVTGTVVTADGCPVLDTGSQRWALLGDQAKRVRDGSRVTVRGRPAAAPHGCGADHALDVSRVS